MPAQSKKRRKKQHSPQEYLAKLKLEKIRASKCVKALLVDKKIEYPSLDWLIETSQNMVMGDEITFHGIHMSKNGHGQYDLVLRKAGDWSHLVWLKAL